MNKICLSVITNTHCRHGAMVLWLGAVLTLTPAVAAPPVQDITPDVQVHAGGFRLDRRTGQYVQGVTLVNTSGKPLHGKLYVNIGNLAPGIGLSARSAKASPVASSADGYWVSVSSGVEPLAPGGQVTAVLAFDNPGKQKIEYRARVFKE